MHVAGKKLTVEGTSRQPCAGCGWVRTVKIYSQRFEGNEGAMVVRTWVKFCSACTSDKIADRYEALARTKRKRAMTLRTNRAAAYEKRFATWKSRANRFAVERLGHELFDDEDSYELAESARKAFDDGQKAEAFVREVFSDELAQIAHDEQMERESIEESDLSDEDMPKEE